MRGKAEKTLIHDNIEQSRSLCAGVGVVGLRKPIKPVAKTLKISKNTVKQWSDHAGAYLDALHESRSLGY